MRRIAPLITLAVLAALVGLWWGSTDERPIDTDALPAPRAAPRRTVLPTAGATAHAASGVPDAPEVEGRKTACGSLAELQAAVVGPGLSDAQVGCLESDLTVLGSEEDTLRLLAVHWFGHDKERWVTTTLKRDRSATPGSPSYGYR